nr:hypothetical protein [Streptomyces sp. YIM 132580]
MLAYVVWCNGTARPPALAASFLSFASPLCATVPGCLFMGQTLGPLQLLGAAGVVGAVVPAQRGEGATPGTPPRAPPAQLPKAAATATTRNMSTSTAAMMRFLVFGSTLRA